MFALELTADLTGVTNLRPIDTPEDPYYYCFQVQCTSCREDHDKWVEFERFSTTGLSKSRGEANFVWKCRNCQRESSASIKTPPKAYTAASPPTKQVLIEFECRGCEFVNFRVSGEWVAEGAESGSVFTGVDLSEDWYDYDEKTGEEVCVKEVGWVIRRA
ncbi:DUF866-domain-containing protein [Choiromyces venosus 120613-1]|uniref:DUF866-domain-containing protein n=1 Tax=Choiromyces venosus 120613-1 TaxID=1336337 RepID=A0A3N4IWF5_9PEZI|nr:DUF866-domain-containing protein [Choiromyces venosus 120613-1]